MEKEKLRAIRKLENKIKRVECKIRRRGKQADFDRRYSKMGQLSESCCEIDNYKIELIELKEELQKIKGWESN